MRFLILSFLLFQCSPALAAPSWLPAFGGSSSSAVAAAAKPRVVVKSVHDTIVRIDTLVKIDTLVRVDTVMQWNTQYKYTIRYALTALNVDIANPEWLDYAAVNEIIARDTATLRVGSEEIRSLGNIVDQFGNKIPQTDIVTTGFTIQVLKDRVMIEYRGKNSLAVFSGNFDNEGFLFATGEIAESSFLANIFPFNLIFGVSKKKIIIEIMREVRQ
jgi:hypothetical protein